MDYPHTNMRNLIYSFGKYDATYFRVPKVASTSILISLRNFDNIEKTEEYKRDSFKFAFVRNPFDRLVSCFRHVIQKGSLQNLQDHPRLARNMSFGSFVDVISEIPIDQMDIHFRPQHTFIPEEPDFLGKFETLDEDYKDLCAKIGIQDNENLIKKNSTGKIKLKDYYTAEIIEKVARIYKQDFYRYGYREDLNT